jgi:hypothetical protein
MPSYGYPRVWAVLRRRSEAGGDAPANRKRVDRIMKKHGLLLQKHEICKPLLPINGCNGPCGTCAGWITGTVSTDVITVGVGRHMSPASQSRASTCQSV